MTLNLLTFPNLKCNMRYLPSHLIRQSLALDLFLNSRISQSFYIKTTNGIQERSALEAFFVFVILSSGKEAPRNAVMRSREFFESNENSKKPCF